MSHLSTRPASPLSQACVRVGLLVGGHCLRHAVHTRAYSFSPTHQLSYFPLAYPYVPDPPTLLADFWPVTGFPLAYG